MSSQTVSLMLLLMPLLLGQTLATAGYHYDRPTAPASAPASVYSGHQFAALPTLSPLPPVPALPALPTPRPIPRSRIQGHPQATLLHAHTPPSAPVSSIISHYLPAKALAPPAVHHQPAPAVVNSYLPAIAAPIAQISYHGLAPPAQPPHQATPVYTPPTLVQHQQLPQPIVVPSGPGQPLRVPYGKQALITPGESYLYNGRQLKQYAVIELIDNDIDQSPSGPFLRSPFFDQYRAHIGASGTGALPGPSAAAASGGVQIDSRANALVLEQQALGIQQRSQAPQQQQGESIALGSGGLGFVRLPNGNVYLGSGSLGYISGQQRVASVLDARTRAENNPDALHFGHGPLGGADNFLRFK